MQPQHGSLPARHQRPHHARLMGREHLALQLPFQVHCGIPGAAPDGGECKVILPEEDPEDELDPRFAILKELKFDT